MCEPSVSIPCLSPICLSRVIAQAAFASICLGFPRDESHAVPSRAWPYPATPCRASPSLAVPWSVPAAFNVRRARGGGDRYCQNGVIHAPRKRRAFTRLVLAWSTGSRMPRIRGGAESALVAGRCESPLSRHHTFCRRLRGGPRARAPHAVGPASGQPRFPRSQLPGRRGGIHCGRLDARGPSGGAGVGFSRWAIALRSGRSSRNAATA